MQEEGDGGGGDIANNYEYKLPKSVLKNKSSNDNIDTSWFNPAIWERECGYYSHLSVINHSQRNISVSNQFHLGNASYLLILLVDLYRYH